MSETTPAATTTTTSSPTPSFVEFLSSGDWDKDPGLLGQPSASPVLENAMVKGSGNLKSGAYKALQDQISQGVCLYSMAIPDPGTGGKGGAYAAILNYDTSFFNCNTTPLPMIAKAGNRMVSEAQ